MAFKDSQVEENQEPVQNDVIAEDPEEHNVYERSESESSKSLNSSSHNSKQKVGDAPDVIVTNADNIPVSDTFEENKQQL